MCNISLTVNIVNRFQNNLNSISIVNFPLPVKQAQNLLKLHFMCDVIMKRFQQCTKKY